MPETLQRELPTIYRHRLPSAEWVQWVVTAHAWTHGFL